MTKEEIYNVPKYAGIYLFRNTINGKCYIGQSIKLRRRLLHHINNFEHDRCDAPIYRAFKKYGLEAFELRILQTWTDALSGRTKYYLDVFEKKYIEEYNSYAPNGYNQTTGGDEGIEGYKFTPEQLRGQSEGTKKTQNDGRNTIYCYDIETGKVIKALTSVQLAKQLSVKLHTSDLRNFLVRSRYIIDRDKEAFQRKIATYKSGNYPHAKPITRLTEEMSKDILEGMRQKDFVEKYKVCKTTYLHYRNKLIPGYKRVYISKVSKEEFLEYAANHSMKECSEHFNIELRQAYKYKQRYNN